MDTAKYFDPEASDPRAGQWKWADTERYHTHRDELHGRLVCPEPNCSAAVNFRAGSSIMGNGSVRHDHFYTMPGQLHDDTCAHNADNKKGQYVPISQAVEEGRFILVNINFLTSFRPTRYRPGFARMLVDRTGGNFYSDWTRANADRYITRNVCNIGMLGHVIKTVMSSPGAADPKSLLRFGYYPGVVGWDDFFVPDTPKTPVRLLELFERLVGSEEDVPEDKSKLWSWTPVLRRQVVLQSRPSCGRTLLCQGFNTVSFSGHERVLRDMIHVNDRRLGANMSRLGRFAVVASPFVNRDELAACRAERGNRRYYLHVNLPVTSPQQFTGTSAAAAPSRPQ